MKDFDRVHPDDGLIEGVVPMTAALYAKVHRVATGEIEDLGCVCRKIVSNAFKQVLTNVMKATAADVTRIQNYKYHEWGTSATAEAATQSGCLATGATTVAIVNGGGSLDVGTQVAAATTYTSVATLTSSAGIVITEHCIHPTDVCATGLVTDVYGLDRSLLSSAITLGSGDSITFTYVLSISGT